MPVANMGVTRFHSRFALLDLELRRLWREPWVSWASLPLLPLLAVMLAAAFALPWSPGLILFRALAWCWCLTAHAVFMPLMGLAFRDEARRGELEALQVAGFSSIALFGGILLSRLVTAQLLLLVPAPVLVLSYLLGGLSASGLLSACLYLAAYFLAVAGVHALIGLVFRGGFAWITAGSLAAAVMLAFPHPVDAPWAGVRRALALATGGIDGAGLSAVLLLLAAALALLLLSWLALRLRLDTGALAVEPAERGRRLSRPPPRPDARDPLRWKEDWFSLGGRGGRWLRRVSGPAAAALLVLLPSAMGNWPAGLARPILFSGVALVLLAGFALSAGHGIRAAQRLFASEHRDETLDDLLLARAEPFGIVDAKLRAYRASSLQIWLSCAGAILLCLAGVAGLWAELRHDAARLVLGLLLPAGFVLFRLQETFVTGLFRSWNRARAVSGVLLAKEAGWFVATLLGYLLVIPVSFLLASITPTFAVGLVPLAVWMWIRHFNALLRQHQRDLIRDFCTGCGDESFLDALNRHYPSPLIRRRGPPTGPVPSAPGPGARRP